MHIQVNTVNQYVLQCLQCHVDHCKTPTTIIMIHRAIHEGVHVWQITGCTTIPMH